MPVLEPTTANEWSSHRRCIVAKTTNSAVETREETRLAQVNVKSGSQSINCDEQYTTLRSGIFTKFARNFSQNTFILS